MGLFDAIAGETKRNFIARSDAARANLVYKYPEKNIRMLTQLTVQPDEFCIFVKGGQVVGRLGPGTHSLDSNNIPFLSSLLEKFTGGNLFIAELYFVSTREVPSIRFGGPLGMVTDTVTQMMCEAKVFGEFSVKVTDAEKFIFGLIGSGVTTESNDRLLDWFKQILLAHMSDAVGELGEKGWPLNKMISPHFKLELAQALLTQLGPEFGKSGLELVRFGNFTLSVSEEDRAELNKRNMAIADDQRRMQMAQNPAYMTVAQAEMMRNAGVGMSKGGEGAGGALQGMGMGMGFAMAQQFGQQMQGGAPAAAPQAVKCPSCGQTTAPGRFCNACGKPLAAAVAKCECGADLVPGAKFCAGCGKPAAGPKKCACGAELAAGAKFCAACGKPAA